MKVRKAVFTNLDGLATLFDAYRVFYKKTPDLPGATSFLRDRMVNNESEIFVAINDDGALTGFVQLYPSFSSTRMKRLWVLNDLFVLPQYRGLGVSVALIETCKQMGRSTQSCGIILETAKDNIIGNNLYSKTGFTADSEHNFYEWENEF